MIASIIGMLATTFMNPVMDTFNYAPSEETNFSTLALELNRRAEELLRQHIAKPISGYYYIYTPELEHLNYYHAHCRKQKNASELAQSNIVLVQNKLPLQIKLKL